MRIPPFISFLTIFGLGIVEPLCASPKLPNIFQDHMVLQREQANPFWGTANPGETISARIAGKEASTETDHEGNWRLELPPLPSGGPYTLEISGETTVIIQDVLVGEVWLASGQSNMEFPLRSTYSGPLDVATAHYPQIRIHKIERNHSTTPVHDSQGSWRHATPENAGDFSGVAYLYARRLHNSLQVPIGIIDNSWGGSAAEAWLPEEVQLAHPEHKDFVHENRELVAGWEPYQQAMQAWKANGQSGQQPEKPRKPYQIKKRPGYLFNGVLYPIIGYGIRGVIWYQGEANRPRAESYDTLFPLLIETWRELWDQGDFPFYWVQLAAYEDKKTEPFESVWSILREAQTKTLALPNTGQALAIDCGQGNDIHPRDKQTVADRLARIALAKTYGIPIDYENPIFERMEIQENRITLYFKNVASALVAEETDTPLGFEVAGEDRKFHRAEARILSDRSIQVWSDKVPNPVAVRYAWADNPTANIYDKNGLPLTPFRSNEWTHNN